VQAAIQEATTTAEQDVIPADWNVVISGAAYAQDGIVYYETDQTQYGDAVDQAAAWWNQNAGTNRVPARGRNSSGNGPYYGLL
jgi:hypothetical protein